VEICVPALPEEARGEMAVGRSRRKHLKDKDSCE
jgi:hypothetical protein